MPQKLKPFLLNFTPDSNLEVMRERERIAQSLRERIGDSLEEIRADIVSLAGQTGISRNARKELRAASEKVNLLSTNLHEVIYEVNTGEEDAKKIFRSRVTERLTTKESEVLQFLAAGNSTADIARQLHLSVNTVKTHLAAIFRKLTAKNRVEAIETARSAGLLFRREQ